MKKIVAIYGSPRKQGNTARLLDQAVEGARQGGARVETIRLSRLKMSPCLEIYGCKADGRCVIKDDFQAVYDSLLECSGLMLASPIFFYSVSAQVKIMMDRCQSLWVKKYWIGGAKFGQKNYCRKGLFIAVGATHGEKLFQGAQACVRYFYDVLDMEPWRDLYFRGLDAADDVLAHPEYLGQCRQAGLELAQAL